MFMEQRKKISNVDMMDDRYICYGIIHSRYKKTVNIFTGNSGKTINITSEGALVIRKYNGELVRVLSGTIQR